MTRARLITLAAAAIGALSLPALSAAASSASPAHTPALQVRDEVTADKGQGRAQLPPASMWSAGGLVQGNATSFRAAPASGDGSYGGCVFYANSYSAGGFCPSGDLGGNYVEPPTLRAWLWENSPGSKFYPCRYYELPKGFAIQAPNGGDGRYVFYACFENYKFDQPWNNQPDLKVDLRLKWVTDEQYGYGIEYLNRDLPDYMYEFWDESSNDQFYPVAQIVVAPSHPTRVNTYTYFQTHWVKALNAQETEVKPELNLPFSTGAGDVVLRARVDNVFIRGQAEEEQFKNCGQANVPYDYELNNIPASEDDGEQPSTCWHMYKHSSADEPDSAYTLRGKVVWRVTLETPDGQVVRRLGNFPYETQQKILVSEQQQNTGFGQE